MTLFQREFSPEEVVTNLEVDIYLLRESLLRLDPDTPSYREKVTLLREKEKEIEQIKKENNIN